MMVAVAGPLIADDRSRTLRAPVQEGQGPPLPQVCFDGSVNDDGTVETGWGWVPSVIEGAYVQVYDSSEFPSRRMDRICICWLRTRPDDTIDFEVVFFRDLDGRPELEPFATVPATATGVPEGIIGAFYEIDVSSVVIPAGRFYVGPRWDANRDQFFFVCADTTKTTPFTNVFFIDDRADEWADIKTTNDPLFIDHRAILVRPVAAESATIDVPALDARGIATLILGFALAGGLLLSRRQGARRRG